MKKALVNIVAAVLTAIISAIILYQTFFMETLLQEIGLLGIFLASMFCHLTVIGRNLFVPAFVNLLKYHNPFLLGLSAGLGAAFGEVTTYYWGRGIQEAFKDNGQNGTLSKWIKKYGIIAILLVASSPLPDTPIVLLAGTARFPLSKFLAIQIVGKSAYYSFSAVVGGAIFQELSYHIEEWILSTIVLVGSLILCVLASCSKSRGWIMQLIKIFSLKTLFRNRKHLVFHVATFILLLHHYLSLSLSGMWLIWFLWSIILWARSWKSLFLLVRTKSECMFAVQQFTITFTLATPELLS